MELFSLKELYDVVIKTTYPIEIGNKSFEAGEIILAFDKISIANFDEIKDSVSATGGFNNRALVTWQSTKEMNINFTKGVFSMLQLSLLSNSKLIVKEKSSLLITKRELKESSQVGTFELDKVPASTLYLYNKETGDRITNFTLVGKTVTITEHFLDVLCHYTYLYTNRSETIQVGNRLLSGYLSLEAKTRLKDDTTGPVTGIFMIPKLKLMSDLSMTLGDQAEPVVADFQGVGYPVGSRGESYVCNFISLDDDIDSDL